MIQDDFSDKGCGRLEFLLTYIMIVFMAASLWLYESRYTRLWDDDSIQHLITMCGHEIIRINAYQMFILECVLLFGLILGNLTFSLIGLSLMVITTDRWSELLYLLLYIPLYAVYYYQGLRRCRDMDINPWRMFIPIYMPTALIFIKGKEKDQDYELENN